MRTLRMIGVLSVAMVLSAGAAAAREIYVNNTMGDDRFEGAEAQSATTTGPVRTIERALRLAGAGDRIVLANTGYPYRESVSLVGSRHSGSVLRPFVLDGAGAVLDGSAPVPPDAWLHYRGAVFRYQPLHTEFHQLFHQGTPAPRVVGDPRNEEPPKLDAGQWCLHRGFVYFCVHPGRLPDQYPLTYTEKQVGVTLFHVRQVAIHDLVVQGFQLDGINAFNSADRVSLIRVTARGNGRSGVAVGGASRAALERCLLGNNFHAQLLTLPLSEAHVDGGELLSNTAPGWVDAGGAAYFDGKRLSGGLNEFRPAAPKK